MYFENFVYVSYIFNVNYDSVFYVRLNIYYGFMYV